MNEAQAIRLCLRYRDPAGFEFLVNKYRREAFFHSLSLMGNSEDAADACQESFRRAFIAIPKLTDLDQFYPWFYRILRNCCLNMLSRRKTAIDYARKTANDHARENRLNALTANTAADPAAILAKQEEQQVVWKTLNRLDPEMREILCLKYIQEKSYEEISRILQIPRGTVMSRLYHARKAFRKEFPEYKTPEYDQKKGEHHELL